MNFVDEARRPRTYLFLPQECRSIPYRPFNDIAPPLHPVLIAGVNRLDETWERGSSVTYHELVKPLAR